MDEGLLRAPEEPFPVISYHASVARGAAGTAPCAGGPRWYPGAPSPPSAPVGGPAWGCWPQCECPAMLPKVYPVRAARLGCRRGLHLPSASL